MILSQVTYEASAGGASVAVYGIFSLLWLALGVFCIVDVAKRSDADFETAGQKKQNWLILTIVGTLCCGFINLYYLFGVRPKLPATA